MALENDYEKLYSQWLEETQQKELTQLSQDVFNKFNQLKKSINALDKTLDADVKNQLVRSYEQNIEYLLKDFLKVREIKIINAALGLQEINYNNVIEAEKLFYMNLVSAIKGFKKVKTLAKFDDIRVAIPERKVEFLEGKDEKLEEYENIQQEILQTESELASETNDIEYNYTLIRFIKKTPPLVGVDLLNYGPFEENDLANLPFKNAKILLSENLAENIDF